MFENVKFKDGLPRWDLSLNPNRALGLRNAIEDRKLWPLDKPQRLARVVRSLAVQPELLQYS